MKLLGSQMRASINIRYLISLVEINLKSIPKSNFVFIVVLAEIDSWWTI